jgi:hypothetical protein
MATTLYDIVSNTKDVYMTDSSLVTLLNFERVLDELNVYAYKNWQRGELVEGPVTEKYFVTCTFMWPHKLMPDPRGGERLLDYDCEVTFQKDTITFDKKVDTPSDFKPGTKLPKEAKAPIWLVSITMPKSLMDEIKQGSVELESETIDLEDIDTAYQDGLDDETQQGQGTEATAPENEQPAQQQPA